MISIFRPLLLFAVLLFPSFTFAADKPNIIYVLADDLGYGDLSCYGQTTLRTANLDKMPFQGIRFTRHYAGSTVCAPSRCVLLTGKHIGHASVLGNQGGLIRDDADRAMARQDRCRLGFRSSIRVPGHAANAGRTGFDR